MKIRPSVHLLIGVGLALLLLFVISLPVRAGNSMYTVQITPTSISPTSSPETNDEALPTSPPTATITPTLVITDTPPISPTSTVSPTVIATSSPEPELLNPPLQTHLLYLPDIFAQLDIPSPPPPEQFLFCDDLAGPLDIPDNNLNGVNDVINITDNRILVNVRLYLDISHTYVGDLVVNLSNQNTGRSITALNRPGDEPYYCSFNDVVTILDDAAAQPVDNQCASNPHAISGIYKPTDAFSIFSGNSVSGTWQINVSDRFARDVGKLNHWCLQATVADYLPAPTPTPTPGDLPSAASISGMWGQDQQLNLDCESRSAVDWARHFGAAIGELDFLNQLPASDDPQVGFVGNPDGTLGNLPPGDYGVHAPPVASVLRQYGLTAQAYRSLQWDDLRAEIASGNPAIVWIIGSANYGLVNGTPHLYTPASTGNTTVVAPYEHTVILIGYSPDDVTLLNGSHLVTVKLDQFLDSWSALDFMAVLARP